MVFLSEREQVQNADVLKALTDICKFTPEQMNEVSLSISKGHSEVARKMGDFLAAELDRVEDEVKKMKLHLIQKLAERRQILSLLKTVGYEEGYQDGIQERIKIHLD